MPKSSVPDWRQTAKGAHHWVDEAAALERKLQALIAEAATVDPIDQERLNLAVAEGRRLVVAFEGIATKVAREMGQLQDWIRSQTSGFLGRMAGADYKAQFNEQFEIYGMVLEGVPDSVAFYRERLAEISPVTETGFVFCPVGHENHPSRQSCLVCASPL